MPAMKKNLNGSFAKNVNGTMKVVLLDYWRYDKLTACGSELATIYFIVFNGEDAPPEYLRVKNTNISPDCWRRYHRISSSTPPCGGGANPSPAYWYDATERTEHDQDFIDTEASTAARVMRVALSGTYKAPCVGCSLPYPDGCPGDVWDISQCGNANQAASGYVDLTLLARSMWIVIDSMPNCGQLYGPANTIVTIAISCAGAVTVTDMNAPACSAVGVITGTLSNATDDECEYTGEVTFTAYGQVMTLTVTLV